MGLRRFLLFGVCLASSAVFAEAEGCREFRTYLNAGVQLGVRGTDWEQALRQFEKAQKFTCSPDDDVKLQLYRGIVLFNMRRTGPAKDAFKQALLLDPRAELPGNFGRKVAAFFEKVREEMPPPPEPVATVTPPDDGQKPLDDGQKPPGDPRPPSDRPVDTKLTPKDTAPVVVAPVQGPRKSYVLPIVLGAAAVAAAGTATYFGLQSRFQVDLANQAEFMDDLRRHLDQAGTSALVANLLFGFAGTLAAGALVAFFWPASEPKP